MILQTQYVDHSGLSKGQVSKLVAAGMPLDSLEDADRWRGAGRVAGPRPSKGSVFERLEKAERTAYGLVTYALKGGKRNAAQMVDLHARTVRNWAHGRELFLKLQQIEGALIPAPVVRKRMQEHDAVVSALVRSMPRAIAAKVAPEAPQRAEEELDRWVDETFLRGVRESLLALT